MQAQSIPDYYRAFCTDTFGGELNFCWKRDALIHAPERAGETWEKHRARVYRAARKALGLSGVRGCKSDYGDLISFRPSGAAMALIVEFGECWFSGSPDDVKAEQESAYEA